MARPLFFQPSRGTLSEVTQLFDFVWPTAAAMWNLRWQVRGFIETSPRVTQADLSSRFVTGSGIRGAANLKRACVSTSWDEQQRTFAKFLLVDLCAIYESWIAQVLACLSAQSRQNETDLQFPTSVQKNARRGVQAAIDRIAKPESMMLRASFYDSLHKSPKNALPSLENLLRCYRYFKEARNSLMHNGGLATQASLDAYSEFSAVATPASLSLAEVPEHDVPVLGRRLLVSLRGVVGLSDVVLRLVSTLDAELSVSRQAEHHLRRQWLERNGHRCALKSSNAEARAAQIARLTAKLGLPTPSETAALDAWLVSERLAY